MLRSVGVIVFIAIVAATGVYFAQRPTVARGHVLAAELVKSNPGVKSLECDERIPIGMTGATFTCRLEMKNGEAGHVKFAMDRHGSMTVVDQHVPKVKKTSDPWGE
jgi:hypothetical protein